jgi:hypothetical protein
MNSILSLDVVVESDQTTHQDIDTNALKASPQTA